MNNIKKVGITALATSLVAVSAHAGTMNVNGSANMTWAQKDVVEGKSIGSDKGLTVSGSGELDNGWTFYTGTYVSDGINLSTHVTTLTMGSLGTVKMGTAFGGVAGGYDEEVPNAYEQLSDHFQNSTNIVGSTLDNNTLVYASPSFDAGGATVSFGLAYSPDSHDNAVNNGYSEGTAHAGYYGEGVGLGVTINAGALTIGGYGHERDAVKNRAAGTDAIRDEFHGVWFAKYSVGPVSFGYSNSYHDAGLTGTGGTANTAKTVGTSSGFFENEQMSIAFNVNDNLSISWSDSSDSYDSQDNNSSGTATADVDKDTDALQIAYSMGGLSIKAYRMEETNPNYDGNATSMEKSEVSLGLAF